MRELVSESMSEHAQQVTKDQGNGEAFVLPELSDKIQCERYHKYMTVGHVCCFFGRLLSYKDPDLAIQDQVQCFVKQRFELFKTQTYTLKKGPGKRTSPQNSTNSSSAIQSG